LLFDDVANDQRKVIYQQRTQIMGAADLSDAIAGIQDNVLGTALDAALPRNVPHEDWDLDGLRETIARDFNALVEPRAWLDAEPELDEQVLRARVSEAVTSVYRVKAERYGPELMQHLEKDIMLRTLDSAWREHLAAMDYLRQGIHLRSYAQKTPAQEYKKEAFELFGLMLEMINTEVTRVLMTVQFRSEAELQKIEEPQAPTNVQFHHADHDQALQEANADADGGDEQTFVRQGQKVGRNDPCPCGSGKKYKYCHGKLV